MMKTQKRILAFLLAALAVFALSACSSSTNTPFERGTVSGNTYTSEFADLTFTKPSGWSFYTDDQISSILGITEELLKNSSAFESASEGTLIDFFAVDGITGNNVNITFTKGTIFTNLDKSIEANLDSLKTAYDGAGMPCTISEKSDAKLGNNDYKVVTISFDGNTMKQYCYFAMCGKYFVNVNCTTANGKDASYFEAMFS